MKHFAFALCLLLLLSALAAESPFAREYANAATRAAKHALIQSYLKQPLSLDEAREVQSAWHLLEPLAMQAYYDSLAAANPQNMGYQYLSLRFLKAADTLSRLRLLLSQAPDFYWNTRLYALNLCECYSEGKQQLLFAAEDETLLKAALQYFPSDAYLQIAMFYLFVAEGKSSLAGSYLAEIDNPVVLAANWQAIESFLLSEKNLDLFDALSETLWLDELNSGNISPEEYYELQELAHEEFIRKIAQRETQDPGAQK